jgi:RloB-like protein
MNDDDWDPDWWKQERDESLERKAAAEANTAGIKLGDSFLIVTEGEVTEPIYFELLLKDLELSNVWIKVMPGKHSHPKHVIQTAIDTASEQLYKAQKKQLGMNEPEMFDHVWAVIDTDVAVRQFTWNEVVQQAASGGVKLAHSTPCFEFWLLLHFGKTTRGDLPTGDAAKAAVKERIGRDYSTNEQTAREVMPDFIANWVAAVVNSEFVRKYHFEAGTATPANPSSEVGQLVRNLNDAAPKHSRRL